VCSGHVELEQRFEPQAYEALAHLEILKKTAWILGNQLSANKPLELISIDMQNFLKEKS
jgi:hypothetical protein